MTEKTTIQVSQDTKRNIKLLKNPGESLDETIRRELGITPQQKTEIVETLVRYLSQQQESQVRQIVDLLDSELNLKYKADESPMPPADFVANLVHPESEGVVARVRVSENDDFRVEYRSMDGLKETVGWGSDWDEKEEELLRLIRGAYKTASK